MSSALMKQSKMIYFSMCGWGLEKLWYGHLPLLIQGDLQGIFQIIAILFIAILEKQAQLSQYAGPGRWNDPDMFEVGNGGMKNS